MQLNGRGGTLRARDTPTRRSILPFFDRRNVPRTARYFEEKKNIDIFLLSASPPALTRATPASVRSRERHVPHGFISLSRFNFPLSSNRLTSRRVYRRKKKHLFAKWLAVRAPEHSWPRKKNAYRPRTPGGNKHIEFIALSATREKIFSFNARIVRRVPF